MQGTFYLIQSNSSLQKNPFIWIQDIYDIISIYDIIDNINFILKHSAPFISWESMYALCTVRDCTISFNKYLRAICTSISTSLKQILNMMIMGKICWNFLVLMNNSCPILIGFFKLLWRKSDQLHQCIYTHLKATTCFYNI